MMPEGMGGDQWMGQVHFESTGLSLFVDLQSRFMLAARASYPQVLPRIVLHFRPH